MSRPRLVELLDQGLTRPLTVVSAPAGYGKSSLVVSWLDQAGLPAAWYSIIQQDNSLLLFAAYLGAAVASAYPAAATALQAVLQTSTTPPPEQLAEVLLGQLSSLPGPLVLVLDDYHEIGQPEIHACLTTIIENAPPGVHFVVLARMDPPLKLARLRARRQVLEVRAAQLRFTPAESLELMRQVLGDRATNHIAALCAERTEGWAAGLHLAALSLRDSADADAFVAQFTHSNVPFIADYLLSEVLDHLPEPERRMLLYASLLPRFCAELLDAVVPPNVLTMSGEALIAHVRSANLFLIALDDEGQWYRFHHLFCDLLRHRLHQTVPRPAVAAAYLAAARWFEAQSLIDEALQHALAAGDADYAAGLVATHGESLLDTENRPALERWFALLPDGVQSRPGLLILNGWLEHLRYRPQSVLRLAQAAEVALAAYGAPAAQADPVTAVPGPGPAPVPGPAVHFRASLDLHQGSLHALRAISYLFLGQLEQAHSHARQAVTLVSPERGFVRGLVEFVLLYTTARLDGPQAAVDLGAEWLRDQPSPPTARTLRILLGLCSVYYDQLDLPMLEKTTLRYRAVAEQIGQRLSIGWARYGLAFAHYQRNDLPAAHSHFAELVNHAYEYHSRTVIDATTGLALSLQAQGCPTEAHAAVEALRRFLLQGGAVDALPLADTLDDYLDLLAGKPVQPGARPTLPLPAELGLDLWVLPSLLRSYAQIRSGSSAHWAEAAATLAAWQDLLTHSAIPRRQVQVDLQIALLAALAGDHPQALAAVHRAVTLAAPGGALRIFADTGPELQPYLQQLARQGVEPDFVARILAAYPPPSSPAGDPSPPTTVPVALPAQDALNQVTLGADALTYRELDVLQLLGQRLSNKEIGQVLCISPYTVQRHAATIYAKLHVNSRRAAVARAHELGLLAPSPK